jgi:hypothetical protein
VVLKRNANVAPLETSNLFKSFRGERGRKRVLIGASTRSAKSASGRTSALTSVERFEEWAVRHLSAVASTVGDALTQFAIVPFLHPLEDERAQHLLWRQSASTAPRLLQPAQQIAPRTLDNVMLVVKSPYQYPRSTRGCWARKPIRRWLPHQLIILL